MATTCFLLFLLSSGAISFQLGPVGFKSVGNLGTDYDLDTSEIQLGDIEDNGDEDIFSIIEGRNSTITKHPYQAAIFFKKSFVYSGAILNKNFIVTFPIGPWKIKDNITVGVGETKISSIKKLLPISKIYTHPNFSLGMDFAISLIKLKTPLKFSKKVTSIKVASKPTPDDAKVTISGWGSTKSNGSRFTDRLKEVVQNVIPHASCKPHYWASIVSDTTICAYKSEKSRPTWFDQGGPLVYQNSLIGIYHFDVANYCTQETCPSLYTDTYKLRDWIKSIVGGKLDGEDE